MKGQRFLRLAGALTLAIMLVSSTVLAQDPGPAKPEGTAEVLTTTFTYQGRLQKGGSPVNDTCDMRFGLYDAALSGTQVGSTINATVPITDGVFTVGLDFGSGVFTGDRRWLGIEVQCKDDPDYVNLGRQELAPVPYALYAPLAGSVPWVGLTGIPAGFADGIDANTTYAAGTGLGLSGGAFSVNTSYRLPQSCDNGQIAEWDGSAWACGDDDIGTSGGGGDITAVYAGTGLSGGGESGGVTLHVASAYRLPQSCSDGQVAEWNSTTSQWDCGDDNTGGGGDYWSLTGNAGTTPGTHFLGTTDDQALELHVNGARALRLEPHSTSPNLIAGYSGNTITAGAFGAAIGGGGHSTYPNRVTDAGGTVGGGVGNQAGDDAGSTSDATYATVGGGQLNQAASVYATVSGGSDNQATGYSTTIGGGSQNTASGNGYATVGGGFQNEASDYSSLVGGGYDNRANADYATIGGGRGNVVTRTYSTVGGGYENTVSNDYASIGGGRWNDASGEYATISGGMYNSASNSHATVAGGQQNVASGLYGTVPGGVNNEAAGDYSFAAGQRAKANHRGAFVWADFSNTTADFSSTAEDQFLVRASGGVVFTTTLNGALLRLDPHATSPNLIGGHSDNTVTAGVYGATIGGGGESGFPNRVTDNYGAVGGGRFNRAGDWDGDPADATYATVGGGISNAASGVHATVGGGSSNTAGGSSATVGGGAGNQATYDYATIAGGYSNQVTANYATVGGGQNNKASGYGAIVPGGYVNTAQGDYSFAAGRYARALHEGAFVWADSTVAYFDSQQTNQFRVRANGGARFDVNGSRWVEIYDDGSNVIGTSTGARLTTGGAWTDSSDRNLKENFVTVDAQEILAHLAEVPITTWSYKAQDSSIRHLGPTAQDFYAVFGLGEDDRHIAALDTSGVALVAIQGLYEQNQALVAENATLRQQLDNLEARVAALEQPIGETTQFPLSGWWVLAGLAIVAAVVGWRWQHGGGR